MGASCCREAENNTIAQPRDPNTKPPRGPKGTYSGTSSANVTAKDLYPSKKATKHFRRQSSPTTPATSAISGNFLKVSKFDEKLSESQCSSSYQTIKKDQAMVL